MTKIATKKDTISKFTFPLTASKYLVRFTSGESWFVTPDEALELFNQRQQFPKNQTDLRFGFYFSDGASIRETF